MNHWLILFAQRIPFERVQISVSDTWFSYDDEIQAEIDAIWQEKVLESERQGSRLWDGNNYRLSGFHLENDMLSLDIGLVKYRNIASRLFSQDLIEKIKGVPDRASGIFVAGLIRSSDGYFVFGERSGRYLCKEGEMEIIGWVLQPDEISVKTIEDVFSWFLKELQEETWVQASYVSKRGLIGMVRNEWYNTGIIFSIDVSINQEEILSLFRKENDSEMKDLIFIPESSITERLENVWRVTPMMLLYRGILSWNAE